MQRLVTLLFFGALLFGAGLLIFVSELPPPTANEPQPADGVVVFTGGSERVVSAMSLLSHGAGKRLLISGVNPDVTRAELAGIWPGEPAQFECCVDLGVEAQTTRGNASELDRWTRANKFQSLILVTSEYHMPRALIEARERLPDVAITPYPVASGLLAANGRPEDLSGWKRISGEYAKFLAARIKTLLT